MRSMRLAVEKAYNRKNESFKKITKMGTFCIIEKMLQSNWITYSYDHDPSKTTDIVLTF